MRDASQLSACANRSYPSAISGDEWALVAPYLTVKSEDEQPRTHQFASSSAALDGDVLPEMPTGRRVSLQFRMTGGQYESEEGLDVGRDPEL
jgi:hypothetical protein